MRRSIMPLAIVTLAAFAALAACGGGGTSTTASILPSSHGVGTLTVSFRVPIKSAQAHTRRNGAAPLYDSPGELGAGVAYAATAPQLPAATNPQFAFNFAQACVVTNGCTQNSDGTKTWSVSAQVPLGTYVFEISTWNAPPSNGSFTGASLLSQGSGTATISSVANPLNFVLNGIPASVTFAPLPGQKHVTIGTGGAYSIIGNGPTTWIANALDAAGYIITGSSSPTMSVSDPTHSISVTPQGTLQNAFVLNALTASLSGTVALAVSANNGGSPINGTIPISTVQELWISDSVGVQPEGLAGYALSGTGYAPNTLTADALDYTPISTNNEPMAMDASGNLWVGSVFQAAPAPDFISEYTQQSGVLSPQLEPVPTITSTPDPIAAFAFDASNNLFVADPAPGAGSVNVYIPPYASVTTSLTVTGANGVAIAPTSTGAFSGTIWAVGTYGISGFKSFANGMALIHAPPSPPPTNPVTVDGFDHSGDLWTIDTGGNLMVYQLGGSLASPTLTALLAAPYAITPSTTFSNGFQMGATAQGTMWVGLGGGLLTVANEYALSPANCIGNCSINEVNTITLPAAPYGIAVAP